MRATSVQNLKGSGVNHLVISHGINRYEQCMKKVSLVELPPTSSFVNGHLERSYYVVNTYVNLHNVENSTKSENKISG